MWDAWEPLVGLWETIILCHDEMRIRSWADPYVWLKIQMLKIWIWIQKLIKDFYSNVIPMNDTNEESFYICF